MPSEFETVITDQTEYGTIITTQGAAIIADCILNGKQLSIEKAAAGDGGGEAVVPTPGQTALVNERWRGEIAGKSLSPTIPNMIDVKIVIEDTAGGFTIREMGLYSDTGVLIAVCNTPATEKVSISGGVSGKLTMLMHIVVADASVLDFVINPSLDTVSRQELEAVLENHNGDPEAHPDMREDIRTNAEAIVAVTKTTNAAKMTADKALETAEAAAKELTAMTHTISAEPYQSGSPTYTGNAQTPSWNNFNPDVLEIDGDTTGTNAGEYTATFTPKEGYTWSDGTTAARTVTWIIGRAAIENVPEQSGSPIYTGSAQSPVWSGYDAAKLTLGGDTTGTNAGTYTASFTPTSNYQWSDGTTAAKTVTWIIGRAPGSSSLNKSSLALSMGAMSGTIDVARDGDGAVSASSSDTDVATVSVSGTTVTVTAKDKGSATITINVAAGTNHTAPEDKTCSVSVTLPTTSLDDNTWAVIGEVSDAGQGENYWSAGDTKRITIKGTVRSHTFSGLAIDVFIIGFNHNSSREGTNRIHFQIGKIGGKDICLCDSNYSDTGASSGHFQMNDLVTPTGGVGSSVTNSGGWRGSDMRKTLLGNSGTPSSPPSNSLMAALPPDLLAVMKPVTKYSDNTGGGGDTASYVTATTDYLFLLSEFEYYGERAYANSAEKNYQLQYAYYKAGNSKVKYKHGETGTAANHWTRSVNANGTNKFCIVEHRGTASVTGAAFSKGVAPGFAV